MHDIKEKGGIRTDQNDGSHYAEELLVVVLHSSMQKTIVRTWASFAFVLKVHKAPSGLSETCDDDHLAGGNHSASLVAVAVQPVETITDVTRTYNIIYIG